MAGWKRSVKGSLPQTLRERRPSGYGAGHGDGVPAGGGHGLTAGKAAQGPRLGRTAGAVQTLEVFAVPEDRKSVAADAVAGWFDHREGNRCRQGCIYSVAAGRAASAARLAQPAAGRWPRHCGPAPACVGTDRESPRKNSWHQPSKEVDLRCSHFFYGSGFLRRRQPPILIWKRLKVQGFSR